MRQRLWTVSRAADTQDPWSYSELRRPFRLGLIKREVFFPVSKPRIPVRNDYLCSEMGRPSRQRMRALMTEITQAVIRLLVKPDGLCLSKIRSTHL
jgi:hypothetical protein